MNDCAHESKTETPKVFKNGTHHVELRCSSCQKFFGYKPQKNPADVILEFGKYSGSTLGSIKDCDPGYIRWLATDTGSSVSRYAQRLLGISDAEYVALAKRGPSV